jgi:Cu/Ag efflux protein CusF
MKAGWILLLTCVLAFPAIAQQSINRGGNQNAAPPQSTKAATLVDGEVREIDKGSKSLTIKHGPIANVDMPAMTMAYQVKDPKMLNELKAGDKIKFAVDKMGGTYIVTRIERQ